MMRKTVCGNVVGVLNAKFLNSKCWIIGQQTIAERNVVLDVM